MSHTPFSEFEVDQTSVKFTSDNAYKTMNCVGSLEEEMISKVVTKKCKGITVKTKVRGTGEGTLKYSLHMPYDIFLQAYGLTNEDFKAGVYAYGTNSRHKEFSTVMHVLDEDGIEKYKAYPNCVIQSGIARKIENGAEEVAEVELEVSVMPDSNGNGLYEALKSDISSDVASAWMTNFSPDLVAEDTTLYTITRALTYCSIDNTSSSVVSGSYFLGKLTADSGYVLPSSVTVNDGTALTSGTDYLYNSTTGMLFINAIDSNTTITVTATAEA